jgi:hypothetical protein
VLNWVPSKSIPKTPYELWTNPHIKKMDSKIFSCYFIDLFREIEMFRFYYPSHTTRIVETIHTLFLKMTTLIGVMKTNHKSTRWRSNLCSKFGLYRGYKLLSFRDKW